MKNFVVTSNDIMYYAIILLLVITCLPLSQCLPIIIRQGLQMISIIMFIFGLLCQRKLKNIIGYFFCVLFSLVYVYNVWKFNHSIVTCVFNVMASFSFCFYGMIALNSSSRDQKNLRRVICLTFLLFVITGVTTIIGLEKYPLAVRELGRSGSGYSTSGQEFIELRAEYKMNNIATWSILYGMVFIPHWLINQFKKERKVYYLILCVVELFCIIKAQLTIATIISILLIIFCVYKPSLNRRGILLLSFIVVAGFATIAFRNEIFMAFISIVSSRNLSMLGNRLIDIKNLFQGGKTGDISARFERYTRSLNLFMQHPICGLSIYGVDEAGAFGNHSDLFDMLGYFGMCGFIVIICMVKHYWNVMKSCKGLKRWEVFVPFVGFLLLFAMNPVWYSPQVFATALMLPCCSQKLNYSVREFPNERQTAEKKGNSI